MPAFGTMSFGRSTGWFDMLTRVATLGELDRLLRCLGFELTRPAGSPHRVYRHHPSDTLIAFPGDEFDHEPSPRHTAAVRRMLIERGIVTERRLERLLAEPARAAGD